MKYIYIYIINKTYYTINYFAFIVKEISFNTAIINIIDCNFNYFKCNYFIAFIIINDFVCRFLSFEILYVFLF